NKLSTEDSGVPSKGIIGRGYCPTSKGRWKSALTLSQSTTTSPMLSLKRDNWAIYYAEIFDLFLLLANLLHLCSSLSRSRSSAQILGTAHPVSVCLNPISLKSRLLGGSIARNSHGRFRPWD